ncbi:MAG TPA: hypothetical protein VJQ44_08790 [Gemmatimonadales bacterium]|nr:hypothetical protein [Gemmatimonadales bacterium]
MSRRLRRRASGLALGLAACGGRAANGGADTAAPVRIVPLAQAIVLETAGPPPHDTVVEFVTGQRRVIVLRHGPPENIVFAQVDFPATAFADSGRPVRAEVRPSPGVYGLDVSTSLPLKREASVSFNYARYFSAPPRAREVYGADAVFERSLAVGQVRNDSLLALLPSTRPASDVLRADITATGRYLVAAAR